MENVVDQKIEQPQLSKQARHNIRMRKLENYKGWLFLLPALVFLAIFTFYPIINSVFAAFRNGYAMSKYGIFSDYKFSIFGTEDLVYDSLWGIENFKSAVTDSYFVNALANTFIIAVITVPGSLILALLIAVALNSIKGFQKFYQTVLFLPYLTNALAIGSVFMVMFQTQVIGSVTSYGLIDTLFHITTEWTSTKASYAAMRTVIITYGIWSGLPFKILILIGALQSVSKQYYDAAKIDGANKFTILRKITIPLISPMLTYLFITGLIGGFKVYTSIVGIFGAQMGPNNDYEMVTIVGLIYKYLEDGQLGVASAASLILFAIIFVITEINTHFIKKRVYY